MTLSSAFQVGNVAIINEAKAGVPILTGIGYLDHMLDQLNSHAQVGVGLTVTSTSSEDNGKNDVENRNRFASFNQVELCSKVGEVLGSQMHESLEGLRKNHGQGATRFCCPLDEALVECVIESGKKDDNEDGGSLVEYSLAPYGIYPAGKGRSKIGKLETFAIESFWMSLAKASKLNIRLHKIRGNNGHHIVESSFKAFSRALRNHLDVPELWKAGSENDKVSIGMDREAKVERSTKETSISIHLLLNGNSKETSVETGIPMLDQFFTKLAQEAQMTLKIKCQGDLWVDDHHTSEDVSIAVGQCLSKALGTKAGLNRMWLADAQVGTSKVELTMDLSNRPCLCHNLHESLSQQEYVDEEMDANEQNGTDTSNKHMKEEDDVCRLSCEMLEHVLDSLVMNSRMTVHIVEERDADTATKDSVMCTAMAFGRALRVCAMVDTRRAGQTASSKGTLSV